MTADILTALDSASRIRQLVNLYRLMGRIAVGLHMTSTYLVLCRPTAIMLLKNTASNITAIVAIS